MRFHSEWLRSTGVYEPTRAAPLASPSRSRTRLQTHDRTMYVLLFCCLSQKQRFVTVNLATDLSSERNNDSISSAGSGWSGPGRHRAGAGGCANALSGRTTRRTAFASAWSSPLLLSSSSLSCRSSYPKTSSSLKTVSITQTMTAMSFLCDNHKGGASTVVCVHEERTS